MKGLSFVTDRALCGEKPLLEVVLQAIRSGASCVQLREKDISTRFFVEEALRIIRTALEKRETAGRASQANS